MTFSTAQTAQLLAPIRPNRVLRDGKGMSHVSQQDITAHLIRVFGFGNHTVEVLATDLVHESCRNPEAEYPKQKWDVVYRATVRVTVLRDHEDTHGLGARIQERIICLFEDSSCGDAQNQVKHDAHDLALKSAISLAKKRATINLGDQFGLSLYNKGQMTPLVGGTHVLPAAPQEGEQQTDLQTDVPQQETLGTDEKVHDDLTTSGATEPDAEQIALLQEKLGARKVES